MAGNFIGAYIMDYSVLEKYITDFIQEQQLKIGYLKEPIRIYYFLSSLNAYTAQNLSVSDMEAYLGGFSEYVQNRFGSLSISREGERFCLLIPKQGVEYIHKLPLHNTFLPDLLNILSCHDCKMEDILGLFFKQPYECHIEHMNGEEFDYLIYFKNHSDDNYRYCFKNESGHITYHRFAPEDYMGA